MSAPSPAQLFAMVDADRSGQISPTELHKALTHNGAFKFDVSTTKLLMSMFDRDRSGTIGLPEFEQLWQFLDQWRVCFMSFDKDRSGQIDFNEFSQALAQFGYRLSPAMVGSMMRAYDSDGSGSLGFDEFIQILTELRILTGVFAARDTARTGNATFDYEGFLSAVYSIKR
mmetsp:Transcript_305/g.853  ORF Transcript_305/g.853 Transcript_305/m.853 type:complete len:171 (-) Transcript_305:135-647(-)|eukprot:CAMPEP_0196780580 /NCGR_PEP_ID=MMETSP1104-20130614/8062_1 /TAXON_ID=33652 /ORGANISM="Cafeteria sp., Strain Caron Lab Isolate" /LENGTH=170 /DNA_ID=CAMNT_0042150793 /DNA_START=11 /DNA_END=523 /DNA_ORIENTATION=+